MARSRAMATREPGQVRKEAALSGLRHRLRECLARADDRHVAAQDVEQLRQLVERQAAHDLADARAAVVALDAAGSLARLGHELLLDGRRDPHRAELEHVELATVETDATLAIEDR